jgi:hypothetical protein
MPASPDALQRYLANSLTCAMTAHRLLKRRSPLPD